MKPNPEKIAENADKCFVCSQATINREALDKMFLQHKELYCKWCGAIHVSGLDGEGYQRIFVKGMKTNALPH